MNDAPIFWGNFDIFKRCDLDLDAAKGDLGAICNNEILGQDEQKQTCDGACA
jgi:hypothetical protein